MDAPQSLIQDIDPRTRLTPERAELATIDASTRGPVLAFTVAAVLWLFIGTVLALIASWKMHSPGLLASSEWLTFGRVRPAHLTVVIYGWGTNVAFAVTLWIMSRLCRTTLRHSGWLFVACGGWNLGVVIGLVGILRGDGTSIEWLEIPGYATPLLFLSYAVIGSWGIVTFRFRRNEHTYVSQWFMLASHFWFPWLYSVAQIMLVFAPVVGVIQALTNWWFAHNILGLWFTPTALSAAYYFIPKVLGKPIYSYHLSVLAFWTFAFFYNWAGVHHLIGGPVPVWVQSAGIVASLMMVIPVIVTGINHHMTVVGSFRKVWDSPTLRFIVFGAVNYTLVSLAGSLMSLRTLNEAVHFTHGTVAHAHHGMYAFYTMVMFGSLYFILPRVLRKEWPSAMMIRIHFWATAVGITIFVVGVTVGGTIQGLQMNDPANHPDFLRIMAMTVPYLVSRTVAGFLIFIGHIAFIVNVGWMIVRPRSREERSPTLFNTPPALDPAEARGY